MGSENCHGCVKNSENYFGLDFLLHRYYKDSDEFLSHIVRVTGDETWGSFVNGESKKQSTVKAVDAHTFTKQAENF
jgi:hypothetical protein